MCVRTKRLIALHLTRQSLAGPEENDLQHLHSGVPLQHRDVGGEVEGGNRKKLVHFRQELLLRQVWPLHVGQG